MLDVYKLIKGFLIAGCIGAIWVDYSIYKWVASIIMVFVILSVRGED